MSPAMRGLGALLALCGSVLPVSADEPPATTGAPVEFSVLTPGLEGKFVVFTGIDLTLVGISHLSDIRRSNALRELVERESYDPCPRIAAAITAALKDAGRTGIHEPISRRLPGRLQSLTLSDLPENPQGALLLDVTIQWIALRALATSDKFRPVIWLTWRLISPRGELVAPGRELRYAHAPPQKKSAGARSAAAPTSGATPAAPPSDAGTQELCSFRSFDLARKDPEALWTCFDEAFLAAGKLLVDQLPQPRQ